MASFYTPRDGVVVKVFLVVVSFLLSPAASIAVDVSVKLGLIEAPVYRRPSEIFARADSSSCPIKNYTQCGSRLPGNMCCSNDSECMVIASNTTVVCCPKGSSCRRIEPIVCNIALQDAGNYPKSPIKTVALNKSMARCGSACCPFGYLCSNDECVLDTNQDRYRFLLPKTATEYISTPTPTSTTELVMETSKLPDAILPGPTAATTTASAATSSASSSDDANSEKKHSGGVSPAGVVTAGTVGGVCAIAGLGIFIWMKWFRKKPGSPRPTPSEESWAYFTPSGTTRQVQLTRGANDKFVITPSTGAFSPLPTPYYQGPREDASPVELPATPVSMSMWMNLENAAVEEPRIAYVLPPRAANI